MIGGERGSGSILTVAIAGALVAITAMTIPISMALVTKQTVAAAADAAALAGADVASGLVSGYPCETAGRVATANDSQLTSCAVDGLVVTVTAAQSILGMSVIARATAGPAGQGVN